MKNNKLVFGGIVLIVVVAAIVIGITMSGKKTDTASNTGSMSSMNMNASSATSTSNKVTIKDYMFDAAKTTVKVGTTVTWTNSDPVNHTITADTVSSDAPSSMDIAQGKSYSFTFTKAGTYAYHCFPHPYMHGTVVVTN